MNDLTNMVKTSFTQYSAAVIQSRALVDVRDGLKPSARQIFYSMLQNKLTADKPHKKTMNAVGMAMADYYIHGDSSCTGIIMRAGQSFAMRYPLVDIKGNGGTLIESGNYAAPRYTESRLSKLGTYLFNDIDKDTIDEWRENYDNTKEFPAVLPTKGFYNIVNGSSGIAIGMACSIPQYNLRELNNALIYLIDHPDCSFDEVYCAPDFATGAILINEKEVKESMKNGQGFACKLRSVISYDSKERCFIATEIPYSVYTNTICQELEEIIASEENPGIERFNDLTGATPLIKIYLTKKANPDKVLPYLYKNTSLQSFYGINFTMLDQGKYPKVFTWKEILEAHIAHEKLVYRRGFEFDLKRIENRIHIIDGLLICIANIDEVVQVIKTSSSSAAAATTLQEKFLLDDVQAKAVLDIKLGRLARLEVQKLEKEKTDLQAEADRITAILENEELFNNEIKEGWRAVAKAFGDDRRTKILNLQTTSENEPVEITTLHITLTNKNNLYVNKVSSLYTQKRGAVGTKFKLSKGEYIITDQSIQSNDKLLLFTQYGNYYHCSASALAVEEMIPAESILRLKENEKVCALMALSKDNANSNILFFTKQGLVKKSSMTEYNVGKNIGIKALSLDEGDEIVSVIFTDSDNVGILTEQGNFVIITTSDIRLLGRVARGIKAIKLNAGDYVGGARAIPANTQSIISISGRGLIKQTPISEFSPQGKNTKGAKLQKLTEYDYMADFYPLQTETELLITSTHSCLKINVAEIPTLSTNAQGNKSIKIQPTDSVVRISCY